MFETRRTGKHRITGLQWAAGIVFSITFMSGLAQAQVPAVLEAELRKMGQGVFPACTAKLYRPLMPMNDYNTYWPATATGPITRVKLYPGVTLSRDVKFGENPKDLVDIFVGDRGPSNNRTVLIYVPGGGGNKIEQQSPESNAFYDNIGRWATENDMVGITLQRSATNIPVLIDWLKTNAAKYRANPERIFIWAHSAGNGPLGQYIGRPDLYGIGVKGAIFMSGNPVNFNAGAAGGARGGDGGRGGGGRGGANTSECQEAGMAATSGVIRGPSSQIADEGKDAATLRNSPIHWNGKQWVTTAAGAPAAPAPAGGRGQGPGAGGAGGGGRGARGGAAPADAAAQPAFTTQDGFRTTRVAIMVVYAELDPGVVNGEFPANARAIHDELCKLEGPKAKDGFGHCPTMFMAKGHSHMSEVFSIGTADKTVSNAVLSFIRSH